MSKNPDQDILTDILLVEDDEGYCLLLQRMFARYNIKNPVNIFENGYDFLDFIESAKYEDKKFLVLLDLNLPLLNGFQILKKIRTSHSSKKLPIIVFSTTARENDIGLAYELGGNAFLKKPISFDDLDLTARKLGVYLQTSQNTTDIQK